jgi:integrase/recombinase XerC
MKPYTTRIELSPSQSPYVHKLGVFYLQPICGNITSGQNKMPRLGSSRSNLERSLTAKIGTSFGIQSSPDVLAQLLAEKRSPSTRIAYEKDTRLFFQWAANSEPTRDLVLEFLHLEQPDALALVLDYKAYVRDKGLADATINRRIAAIKSLVAMGRKLGACCYTLEDIKSEKVTPYRDTTGISPQAFKTALAIHDRETLEGKRNYAILVLLWANALRRNEIVQTNLDDFDPDNRTLRILGKGKGTQTETIDLSRPVCEALASWIAVHPCPEPNQPLFVSLKRDKGHRLTGESLRYLVDQTCRNAGIKKRMSPHRIRHSSITAALDSSGGNVRKVKKLSRHSRIETLLIYDDNRQKDQLELSEQLSQLFD